MSSDDAPAAGNQAAAEAGQARPVPFDPGVAHQARMYDYLLGGKDNYTADREAVEATLKAWPEMGFAARANRAFLGRVVRFLAAEAGIRQFLDLGTGIPTAGNTHEVAQAIAPQSRVVYVDYDPVVLAHARALLASHQAGATAYVDADLRDSATVLAKAAEVLDFSQPVAVTLLTTLHAIPDEEDPQSILAAYMTEVTPGSYLAISHSGAEFFAQETKDAFGSIGDRISQGFNVRTRDQLARLLGCTELVEPGLVPVEEWRPDGSAGTGGKSSLWGAVGRKR